MPTITIPDIDLSGIENASLQELREMVRQLASITAKALKEIEWLANGRVDSRNVREIAGYNVSETELKHKSGIVGMSGADHTNPNAIRFWAGNAVPDAAPFRVQQDGTMYATDGNFEGNITASDITGSTITGGTVRTAEENKQRIEMSNGSFKGYTADNKLSGLVFDPNKLNDIIDLFLYHRGAKLVEFYDNITSFKIRGAPGATGFHLGGNGVTTYAEGPWSFSNATSVSGLYFSFSGVTSPGGADNHTHSFSVSGYVTKG